ncbi:lipase 1-like [Harmonia axyridis]|uniref:lipase 1-like n=1 Tax=Harmonia axyridis TaxID=115357 RepID=UPI001E279D46|nr:lipase 1-like [Harmonia axyridis]
MINLRLEYLIFFAHCLTSIVRGQIPEAHPDSLLSITELLEKNGFPAESHDVVTQDGYILTIYRVPHGRGGSGVNSKPILMMHGLFGMAENYVVAELMGSGTSMAGYFADRGYDVWLGNSRGNQHARRHVKLDPDKLKFWNFSYHEIAVYDISGMVDHILKTSGKKKLYYIGHSQGGTVFYILNSMRPEYQKKFIQASLLAPAGLMKHFNNSLMMPLVKRTPMIAKMVENAKIGEFPPKWFNLTEFMFGVCTETPLKALCQSFYHVFAGGDSGEFYGPMLVAILRFLPTVAVKQVMHFSQSIHSGHFSQWDYGKKKNLEIYGTEEPPEYPIHQIQVPIALYYGLGDNLVFPGDIEEICTILPKCTKKYLLPNPKWTHLDFIFSTHLIKELNEPVLTYMNTFKDDD